MAEVPGTLEGWYALHEFRRLDWARWKTLSSSEQAEIAAEAAAFLEAAEQARDSAEGSSALYSIVGHKADLGWLHLRPTVDDLNRLERAFARTRLADLTTPVYSYISVTELSLYEAQARSGEEEPSLDTPWIRLRLKPPVPDMKYMNFYPMNKRRGEVLNWYAASMEERRRMMREHGTTGRKYANQITQMITGSTGLDDWEWGVTLFTNDALALKKLVYEMRFDEVSAKYAEFGPFYLGIRVKPGELADLLLQK